MSKGADKNKVFQTTRVRTTLKNDGFWIHKIKQEDEEQDKERTEHVVETKPSPVRQNSYVLSTAKLFGSVECPVSPPHYKTHVALSEGISTNQADGEVVPPVKDAQPEGSTVETTDDAKPQASTEELIQNGEALPEKSVADNVEHNDGAAEVSAEVHVAESVDNGEPQPESTKENPEAALAEQPVTNASEEYSEANVSAEVEDPVAETSAAVAEVPAAPTVELTPQEEPSTETELANAGVESTVKPEAGSCEEHPPEQAAEEIVEALAEVVAKSSPETSDIVDATPGEEAAPQDGVDAVAEDAVVTETPAATDAAGEDAALQDSVEVVVEDAVVTETQETAPQDSVEAVAEDAVAPETPAATDAAGEEAALQHSVEVVVEDAVVTETQETAPQDSVEAVAEDAVVPETPAATDAPGEEAASQVSVESVPDLVAESVSESPTQTATETAAEESCETVPPEQAAEEVVEAVAEVAVESSLETPTGAAGEEDAPQVSVEPVPDLVADTVSELPPQAAETAVESVVCEVVSTASAEPVVETRTEEAVECEVQSVDNVAVEQSVEPAPERTADDVVKIEDAVEAVTVSDAEAVQSSDRPVELSEALDVELPTTEAAPEPLEDPKQSHTEETKLITEHSDTIIDDMLQKYKEELQSTLNPGITWKRPRIKNVCSFCDKLIDGNIKIHLSDPVVTCHPDCLKCGVCAKALGDMLTPMFFHDQLVQCCGCFVKTLT